MKAIKGFVKTMRPKQWTKNLLLFAALVFSLNNPELSLLHAVYLSFIGFLCFCFVSSCVYVLNDFADVEKDKIHPEKRHRPMASGDLHPLKALLVSFVLLGLVLYLSFHLSLHFFVVLILYYMMNVAYSFWLKNVVILDVMIIALGFIFRAMAGAFVISVPLTSWFFLCTMFLALFLAISKRRHELVLLEHQKESHRKVLAHYSLPLLDQMNIIAITGSVFTYSLFAFTSPQGKYLIFTVPLVIYGIFRYLYLIHIQNKGGSPDKVLLEDKPILFTVLIYAITITIIMFLF